MPLLALDDRDAGIVYSTGWSQAGSSNEFNSTTTFSRTVGATADVTFFGTGITVYGTIAGSLLNRPTSSYSIDNGAAVTFTGSSSLSVQYNQVFFRSPTLPLANHTLKITNTGDDASTFIDYLLVIPPDGPQTTTVTTTLTPTATPGADRTVTVTSTVQAAASGQVGNPANAGGANVETPGGGSNAGAIAGGIIGGLAFLALLIFGLVFWRRRLRRQRGDADNIAAFWNTGASGRAPLPSPPLAPQFQGYSSNQPPSMVQTNNTGYSNSYQPTGQYTSSSEQAAAAAAQYAPPPTQYSPPSTQMNARPPSTSLPYYSNPNDAYGGYADPGPYPAPSSSQAPGASVAGVGAHGRVRVNLDG